MENKVVVINLKPDNCICWVCQSIDKQNAEREKK